MGISQLLDVGLNVGHTGDLNAGAAPASISGG